MKAPKLSLVPNWRRVLRKAWSVRFMLLAGLFSAAEVAVPLLGEVTPIPPRLFAVMAGLSTGCAFIFRLVAQHSVSGE